MHRHKGSGGLVSSTGSSNTVKGGRRVWKKGQGLEDVTRSKLSHPNVRKEQRKEKIKRLRSTRLPQKQNREKCPERRQKTRGEKRILNSKMAGSFRLHELPKSVAGWLDSMIFEVFPTYDL